MAEKFHTERCRTPLATALLAGLFCLTALAEDVFPGVCSFDPPAGLKLKRINEQREPDPSDDPTSMRGKAVTFQATDLQQTNLQALSLCVRLVGVTVRNGRIVSTKPVSDADLKAVMSRVVAASALFMDARTNSIKVEEAMLAGHKALRIQKTTGDVLVDLFWIHTRPNEVLQVNLVGSGETLLASAHSWLSGLRIQVPAKATPSEKKLDK